MPIDQCLADLATTVLHIGNRHATDIVEFQHGGQIVRAAGPNSDDPQIDPLVRQCFTRLKAQHVRWHDHGRSSHCRNRGSPAPRKPNVMIAFFD
ncbi:MAG: hypothetical protein R3C12_11075 [Planctomycetaceae bacterium]